MSRSMRSVECRADADCRQLSGCRFGAPAWASTVRCGPFRADAGDWPPDSARSPPPSPDQCLDWARLCRRNALSSAATSTWCSRAVNRVWPERLAASFTRTRFGCKGRQRLSGPSPARRDPFLPLPFLHRLVSFGDFIDSTERSEFHPRCGELWLSLVRLPHRRPPVDADGPHRFRNGPFGRDVVQAPGGASGLSHDETGCAAFAGAGASSAYATRRFRESMPHPRPTAVYASGPALPRRPQDSLPSCLLGFERTRLSLASSFQLSSRTPQTALQSLGFLIGGVSHDIGRWRG